MRTIAASGAEVGGEGQLAQALVAFDQRHRRVPPRAPPGRRRRPSHRRASARCAARMSLRSGRPAASARGAARLASDRCRPCERRPRRRGCRPPAAREWRRRRSSSAASSRSIDARGQIGPGGIVDQHAAAAHVARVPSSAARTECCRVAPPVTETDTFECRQRRARRSSAPGGIATTIGATPSRGEGFGRMAHQRLAAPARELLGQRRRRRAALAAATITAAMAAGRPWARALARLRAHRGNPLCAAQFLGTVHPMSRFPPHPALAPIRSARSGSRPR